MADATKTAFESVALTAACTDEVRTARRDEVDLARAVWSLPADPQGLAASIVFLSRLRFLRF